jgi:hypothetical protein
MVSAGYKVDTLMAAWHGEYPGGKSDYYDKCDFEDPHVNGRYFGFNLHPYETLFVKANRDIDPKMIEKLTQWHDNMKYSSYDVCLK